MAQDELTPEPRPVPVNNTDDDQAKIQTYEEAFRRIKEATGVSDTQAGVLCCLPVIRLVKELFVVLIVSLFCTVTQLVFAHGHDYICSASRCRNTK